MYQVDHDEAQDMVISKISPRKTHGLNVLLYIFFDENWFFGICGYSDNMFFVIFEYIVKNENFFIHLKRPCSVQILTAETTWSKSITGSKGQTEVTSLNICKHPVGIRLSFAKKIYQDKKCLFEAKIGQRFKPNMDHFNDKSETPHYIEKMEEKTGKLRPKNHSNRRLLMLSGSSYIMIIVIFNMSEYG